MADRVGQRLGNYRLVRLLGRGGFAEVYLGQHVRLNMQAAIKVLHTQLADDDVENFHREAETIASLIHPHIVRLLDFDVKEGIPFLIMDYAPNGSLRQLHPKGMPLPLPTIVSYAKQVAFALQYAHDKKIIHRDVKPENMLLGRSNEVLLSDFGIAMVSQSSRYQATQEGMGTIHYMAPEQLQGKPRLASDQYALGVVVYEWLSGNRPFHGSFTEIAAQHLAVAPPPLYEKIPAVSPNVEQVVLRALAKDPQRRFPSVQDFATALEQACPVALPASSVSSHGPALLDTTTSSSQPPQPTRETVSSRSLHPLKQTFSRRTVVLGLIVLGAATVGIVGLDLASSSRMHITPMPTIPPATPTSPPGTTLLTYTGHSYFIWSVAWSPDSKRIASGSWDQTVQVWDATDGAHVFIYHGHSKDVVTVAWSLNGNRIASGGGDKTIQVWDASTGGNVLTYRGHSNGIHKIAWSPDGKHIVSGSFDNTAQVWDASTGDHVLTYRGHSDVVYWVAWSPDGKHIVSGSRDKTAQVWDASTGDHILTYQGHSSSVDTVAWSPDGKRIASAGGDKTVQVWDAFTGENVLTYRGHSMEVHSVAWSPDGKRIASGSFDHTVQVWDASTGRNVLIYRGHSSSVFEAAWSPDGKRIASGSLDNTVQVWSAG
jgi:eukaryotic-like serine/threonine-protein kinase